jgi:hypothetical protein
MPHRTRVSLVRILAGALLASGLLAPPARAANWPQVKQEIKSAAHDTGHAIVQGAHAAGHAIRHTAHALGSAIHRAVHGN